jgi:hypothetical protein
MNNTFSVAPNVGTPRSMFDRSFGHKMSFDVNRLIPFYVDDVLPGDTFNLKTSIMCRLATPLFPIMDNVYLDTHFFFVPLRLVWENSRKFFGEQANPADLIDFTIPKFNSFTVTEASISDYIGLPLGAGQTPNSIYHRGYNLIWNEWFRDQNLQDSAHVDTDDGPDTYTDYAIKKRGKRRDYFTSALPWPQKGETTYIPIGTSAPVTGMGIKNIGSTTTGNYSGTPDTNITGATGWDIEGIGGAIGAGEASIFIEQGQTNKPAIYADFTNATLATLNEFREAVQVGKLLERDARSGTRYSEIVNSHFGVKFYDPSYRPEFLGGGSTPLIINQVTSNSDATGATLGQVGAFGIAADNNHGFTKSFHEHGFVMGLISTRADLTYQQGVPRHFTKQTRYDIYWPTLAHLGEQAILNKEIYWSNVPATDDAVFGYIGRYDEYRYKPSQISGAMRSTAATSLDAWHLSQEFGSVPTLGNTFITEDTPISRVTAVPSEPDFICDTYTSLRCARPMPVFAVPGQMDHF